MMVSITTMAAIIGLLVNARNLGLAPWLRTGSISFADLSARRVLVAPPADTLRAVGDTLHLAATVTDDRGSTIAGATILWTTDDSTVATVDSAGDVVARGAGQRDDQRRGARASRRLAHRGLAAGALGGDRPRHAASSSPRGARSRSSRGRSMDAGIRCAGAN